MFVVLNSGLKAPDSAHNWKGGVGACKEERGKWLFRERWPPVRLPKHQRQLRTQKKFLTRHKTFVSYFLLFCENLCKLFQAPVLRSHLSELEKLCYLCTYFSFSRLFSSSGSPRSVLFRSSAAPPLEDPPHQVVTGPPLSWAPIRPFLKSNRLKLVCPPGACPSCEPPALPRSPKLYKPAMAAIVITTTIVN